MLRTVVTGASDEARWADALAGVARIRPQGAAGARNRRGFVLVATAGVSLAGVGLILLVGVLVVGIGPVSTPHEVPRWQTVTGLVLAGLGLVVQIGGVVVQWRALSRAQPLIGLTRRQRKELLAQIRGQQPVEPERLPLTRHLAEQQTVQARSLVANVGLLVLFLGQAVEHPEWIRVGLTLAYAVVFVVAWSAARRGTRSARRFLDLYGLTADR